MQLDRHQQQRQRQQHTKLLVLNCKSALTGWNQSPLWCWGPSLSLSFICHSSDAVGPAKANQEDDSCAMRPLPEEYTHTHTLTYMTRKCHQKRQANNDDAYDLVMHLSLFFYTTLHLVLDGDGHRCCALVRLTEDWQKQRDERNAHRVSMFEQVLLDNHSSSSSPFAENAAANGREHTHWLSGLSFSCTDYAATSQREEEHTGTDTNWSIDSLPLFIGNCKCSGAGQCACVQ